jgi:Flp pilus assembly pilin Flp
MNTPAFRKRGQTMTEYIIILVVIALAAIVVVAALGNRIQGLFRGATEELGGQPGQATDSQQYLKDMGN